MIFIDYGLNGFIELFFEKPNSISWERVGERSSK